MIETKVYKSSSGSEWEHEIVHPCKRASSGRVCDRIERKTTRAGLVERRPSRHRRDSQVSPPDEQRRVSIIEQRRDVGYGSPESSDASSAQPPYPAAPSPPLPSRYDPARCPLQACPVMSGGLGSDDGDRHSSASYDFIIEGVRPTERRQPASPPRIASQTDPSGSSTRGKRREVLIEVRGPDEYSTPKLSAPPLRRKSLRIDHKRVDSGKAFPGPSHDDDQAEERARQQDQASQERYEAHVEAIRRRQDAADDARSHRLEREDDRRAEQERLRAAFRQDRSAGTSTRYRRESVSRRTPGEERARVNAAAAESARRAGERVQRAEVAERDREKRLAGERRSAERERQDAEARRRDRDWAMQRSGAEGMGLAESQQRRNRALPVVHHDPGRARYGVGEDQRARGEEVIAAEQARLARTELAATMREVTLGGFDEETGVDAARVERMRRYRDDQRRRIGI